MTTVRDVSVEQVGWPRVPRGQIQNCLWWHQRHAALVALAGCKKTLDVARWSTDHGHWNVAIVESVP